MVLRRLIKRITLYSAIALLTMSSWTVNADAQLQSGHYRTAEKALARGHTDKAMTELKLALQDNPLDSKSHYMLGTLLAKQGLEDQAIIGFQRTLTLDPTHPKALHNLGTLLLKRGEAVSAAELLEAAVSIKPEYLPPYNSLAKAYFAAGLPELAIAAYEEVLRRDPENSVANQNHALLVVAAKKKQSPKRSTADLEKKPEHLEKLPEHFQKLEEEKEKEEEQSAPKSKESAGKKPKGKSGKDTPPPKQTIKPDTLRKLLRDMPYLTVEEHDDALILTGWIRGSNERKKLDRILAKWPNVLDLTGTDSGDPQRMLEVDAVLFVVIGTESQSVGFNFLRQINLSYSYYNRQNSFSKNKDNDWKGLSIPGAGSPINLPHWGSLLVASVDYDVNIANAVKERVAVLARPHLTTMNGTPAYFLAGGEFVFRVSGLESGDIKPYPFGTSLTVTPTLLRTPGEDGTPRVHIDIQAQRTSVLEFLSAATSQDSIVFDKLMVNSQAVLDLGQTLILSGLNQREARVSRSGVPVLKEVPLLKYVFSQETTVETNTAIIILLTPRDPAFMDERNRRALSDYIQTRRDLIMAKQGTEEDMLEFQERHPDWQKIPPNRFSSHFFLLENSDLYRSVSSEDLIEEDLDLDLLGDVMKTNPKNNKKDKKKDSDDDENDDFDNNI